MSSRDKKLNSEPNDETLDSSPPNRTNAPVGSSFFLSWVEKILTVSEKYISICPLLWYLLVILIATFVGNLFGNFLVRLIDSF